MRRSVLVFALLLGAVVAGCRDEAPTDPIPPHDTLSIDSSILGETRVINVFLPPGYDGTRAFDMVYMPDGGIAEDFPHIANTLSELMAAGEVAPVILVGIENTRRRRDLTPPTTVAKDREIADEVGGSAAFRRFVRDELIPAIEARYRCTGDRAIIGESLAGLFIVDTFFHAPDLFDRYVAVSPSLWWNDHELVRRARERLAARDAGAQRLFVTAANETDIYPFTDELAAILAETAPAGLTWVYEPHRDEEHWTIFRAAKADGFRAVLKQPGAGGGD